MVSLIQSEQMTDKKFNRKTGNLGEDIAVNFLKNKGFSIIERNYSKVWGEIDIVARETSPTRPVGEFSHETSDIAHFIEVKSVSHETKYLLEWAVSHETWRPEEMVHSFKLNQIRKAMETWVHEHNWQGKVQIDVVAVRMVPREKYAQVEYIDNVL